MESVETSQQEEVSDKGNEEKEEDRGITNDCLCIAAPKKPLKKEDLDKELDKYMSTSNN